MKLVVAGCVETKFSDQILIFQKKKTLGSLLVLWVALLSRETVCVLSELTGGTSLGSWQSCEAHCATW